MASLHELTIPIGQDTLKSLQQDLRKPLESLQGNILRGHGRDRSVHIFLHFKDKQRTEVKQWISGLAEHMTSAQQQLDEAAQYRQYGIPGRLFMSFFLSASGYTYLGFAFPNEPFHFDNAAFPCGMKAARHRLNDPPITAWEKGYQQDIHALVLLADNDEHFLLQEAGKLIESVKTHAAICAVEHGRVMRNAQGASVEHFGYVDSFSQPLFFQDRDITGDRQEKDRSNVWDSGVGPDVVLVPDPYGRKEDDRYGRVVKYYDSGSYLVFRKLEQHVRAFKTMEKKLAAVLSLTGEDAERVGALVVGRFKDGTPVVLQPSAGRPTNNFTYDEDPDGEKCPLQSHIRKVNPRQKDIPLIVRRGSTYGKREKEPKDNPSFEELPLEGVGLLFMCYQKNIEKQFEFLQLVWANNPRFPGKQEPGIDAVIGQPDGSEASQQKWPAQWNDQREKHKPFDFYGAVTLKGGEYFFAPSLYFLRNILSIR